MKFACLELVNSEQWDGFGRLTDHLNDPAWVEHFLLDGGLTLDQPLAPSVKTKLVELRAILRRIVEAVAADLAPSPDDLAVLNGFLAANPAYQQLVQREEGYRLELVPVEHNERWVLAELAASGAQLLAKYEHRRIKVCPNAGCRWVFYDETRGNVRRWCTDAGCGNRDKVRRFRERQTSAQRD